MKKINVTTAFRFSHDGLAVTDYEIGAQELLEDAAAFAVAQKFAAESATSKPVAEKSDKAKAK